MHYRAFMFIRPIKRLLSPSVPLWRYCLEAWPIALIPSGLLVILAFGVFMLVGTPIEMVAAPSRTASLSDFFGVVIFAPIMETFILAGVLNVLGRMVGRPVVVAMLSACFWGLFHGFFGALWFFGSVWSFFVFSCAYLAWRESSFKASFVAASVPHALVNLTAMALVALDYA